MAKYRSEKDFIDGFRSCKEDAITAYYRAKRALFWGTLGRQFSSVPEEYLEDAYSDSIIFLKDSILRGKFKTDSGLDSYFMRIATLKVHEREREWKRQESRSESGGEDSPGLDERPAPSSSGSFAQVWEKLDEVVGSLSETCRELIRLHYIQNMKMKEVAERMGYASEQVAKNKHKPCKESLKERANAMNLYEEVLKAGYDEYNYAIEAGVTEVY